jgi:predicted small lipoprotein YifL
MTLRLVIVLAASLALAGCGVKSDLEKPSAQAEKNEKDPSKPPSQLGK